MRLMCGAHDDVLQEEAASKHTVGSEHTDQSGSKTSADEAVAVMTFNIRCDSPHDPNLWTQRRADVVNVVRTHAPDLLGTQEGDEKQFQYLRVDWNLVDRLYRIRSLNIQR